MKPIRGGLLSAVGVALSLLLVTATALAVTGDLTQPAGTAGCISESGQGPCADGHGLYTPRSVTVSPDGKNVYVASLNGASVARLDRNTTTGAITQPAGAAGCVSEDGSDPCADGHALLSSRSVAGSPDGKSLYVASSFSDAVARLNRDPTTGSISQPSGVAGCVSDDGTGPCADGHGLQGPEEVAVSPDGKNVYAAVADGVVRFNRNMTTGAIAQPAGAAGCISETGAGPCADGQGLNGPDSVAVSPDGKSVYVASEASDAVVRLNRNPSTGAITQPGGIGGCVSQTGAGPCADGHGLRDPHGVTVSPDGTSVYAVSGTSNAVAHFRRGTTYGAITQPSGTAGCVSEDGAGPCANGRALRTPFGVAVSPDGKSVYVASFSSFAVARFNRSPTTGGLTQPATTAGCVSQARAEPCADGHALDGARSVAVSPDGRNVYVAGYGAVARLNRAP